MPQAVVEARWYSVVRPKPSSGFFTKMNSLVNQAS